MSKIAEKTGAMLLLFFVILFFGCKEETISNIPAQQVTLDNAEVTLDPGETLQLTATVTPENAGNTAVFWKSNNEKIATVDKGVITALSPGVTSIVAIAYSNTDARNEITVTVTGVPEDLAAAVAGTYVGTVTMGGMPIAANVEATLTAADNKVRLATEAVTGMGTLSMDIEVDVQRNGERYGISGSGVSSFGAVSVNGTIDAEGNMTLTITLSDAGIEVVFTAKRGQTTLETVTGTYVGTVGIPMLGELPNIELTLALEGSQVMLATTLDIPTQGTLVMNIPVSVTRDGENYAVAGTGTTELFGPVSISGTVSAAGAIRLTIHVEANGMDVTYTGQKPEDLAAIIAGTYKGTVSAQGMGAITGNDVAMILTAVNRTAVHWETHTTTPLGDFDVADFELTIARSGDDFTVTGSGNSSVGPLEVSGTINASGHVIVNMTGPGLPMLITYEGEKQ